MQFCQEVTDAFVRFTVILFLLPVLKILRAAAAGSKETLLVPQLHCVVWVCVAEEQLRFLKVSLA